MWARIQLNFFSAVSHLVVDQTSLSWQSLFLALKTMTTAVLECLSLYDVRPTSQAPSKDNIAAGYFSTDTPKTVGFFLTCVAIPWITLCVVEAARHWRTSSSMKQQVNHLSPLLPSPMSPSRSSQHFAPVATNYTAVIWISTSEGNINTLFTHQCVFTHVHLKKKKQKKRSLWFVIHTMMEGTEQSRERHYSAELVSSQLSGFL